MKEPELYLVKIDDRYQHLPDGVIFTYQYIGNKISIYHLNNSLSKSLTQPDCCRLNHNDYMMIKGKGGTIVYREGKKDIWIVNLVHFDFYSGNFLSENIKKIIQVLDRSIKINKVLNE